MDIFKDRYSCRAYDHDADVAADVVRRVMEAARVAPSACNRQPWIFLIVDNEKGRAAVREAYNREWIATAPIYIIAFGLHDEAWHRSFDNKDHTDIDVAIAVEHICLAATREGLGTCWVCNFDPEVIRRSFSVPENLEPVAIIPIGYPARPASVPDKVRKTFEEIVRYNSL